MLFIGFLSYFLAPLMLIGGNVASHLVTTILGFSLGWFISIFIRELDHLTHHHHSALMLVVVVGAIVGFSSVHASLSFGMESSSNPFWHSVLFSLFFMIPYFSTLRE